MSRAPAPLSHAVRWALGRPVRVVLTYPRAGRHRALAELLSFPAGRTDDIADATGLLGRLLDKMFGASIPKTEEKTIDDYHHMQGFSYLDDGLEGEDTWRTI